MRCRVVKPKGERKRVRVLCMVKITRARTARLRWALRRGGETVVHGTVHSRARRATIELPVASRLRKGRDVPRIAGRKRGGAIVVGSLGPPPQCVALPAAVYRGQLERAVGTLP